MAPARDVISRFREKLGERDPKTGCIEWLGHHDRCGYARIWDNDRKQSVGVARLIYTLTGEDGTPRETPFEIQYRVLEVGQSCSNKGCCNRQHFYLAARTVHRRIWACRSKLCKPRKRRKHGVL